MEGRPKPSISVLKNRIFNCGSGKSWVSGFFESKLSLSRGGRSLRQGGVSKDYFAFKIEKCDPPLTKIRY